MFDRYTEAARRTLFFARNEASELGSSSLGTEHLLLGLLRGAGSVMRHIFAGAGVFYDEVRKQITELAPAGPKIPTSVEIAFTEEAKQVLAHSAEEADRLGFGEIGPEHLLLGLLRASDSIAADVLAGKGLTLDRVRKQVQDRRGSASEPVAVPSRAEALVALDRVSALLEKVERRGDSEAVLVTSIQLELDVVRRALTA